MMGYVGKKKNKVIEIGMENFSHYNVLMILHISVSLWLRGEIYWMCNHRDTDARWNMRKLFTPYREATV